MWRDYGGWPPYVPAAERRRQAVRAIEKMRGKGQSVAPVTIEGRKIATTFWGKAWCDNLESYRDYENRLPRGRTYVRNGSVLDLQIGSTGIAAIVSGSEIYRVSISISEVGKKRWAGICKDCAGGIDSLVELLQGRFSTGVMERLCRQDSGLFPRPSEIRFSCSCPDYASMCKHVAAVLYGVGARLDHEPELLFRLRAVNEAELVTHFDAALPAGKALPSSDRVLDSDDLSQLFGVDIDAGEEAPPDPGPPARQKRAAGKSSSGLKPDRRKKAAARKSAALPGRGKAGSATGIRRSRTSGSPAPKSDPPGATAMARRKKTARRTSAGDA